jgi:hypothetical protein
MPENWFLTGMEESVSILKVNEMSERQNRQAINTLSLHSISLRVLVSHQHKYMHTHLLVSQIHELFGQFHQMFVSLPGENILVHEYDRIKLHPLCLQIHINT